MNSRNILVADLIETIRIDLGGSDSQEKLFELIEAGIGGLQNQEDLLEYIKGGGEGLLSQDNLRMLVSLYRESLDRQEHLLRELSPLIVSEWHPPDSIGPKSRSILGFRLKSIEQATSSVDLLVQLKGTLIGRLYVTYLKRIPIVRSLTIRVWRTAYPIYASIVSRHLGGRASRRWRPLIKMTDHVETLRLPTTKVFDATRVDTPAPNVFPAEDQTFLVSPHAHYVFPPVYVAELGEALIYGGTNLVFSQDAVICHDLYDFASDYTSEELHGRHVIDTKRMRMRLLRHDPTPVRVAVAAAFVDACAPNYAHWMTEVLPRIAVFCSIEQYEDIPIIINEGLHRNIMESLALIVGPERQIFALPLGRAAQVDRLYLTSVAGYVPFERREAKTENHAHGLFCPLALELLRERLAASTDNSSPQGWPRKIYIRRTGSTRKVTNGVEIEELLLSNGFVAVEPEKLTFSEQMALFSNAEEVVGSSGAALANLIFLPPTSAVNRLIGKLSGTSYWYWQNIACASGKRVRYVLGNIGTNGAGIHSDFEIDIKSIAQKWG